MNTNQLASVWNDYSEAAPMVDLDGACIPCYDAGTVCSKVHPTASQWIALHFGVAA
jgi:hypothetical protein